MIASVIGKTFLEAYNKKFQKNYTAKEFFVEEYFPLFFDGDKYMQWVTNSPFVQGLKKGCSLTHEERIAKLQTLINNISTKDADASIAIGFPSLNLTKPTSSQVTNMPISFTEEDIFSSWIGGGFGVGIQSDLSIFFGNAKILLDIYDGWKWYRNFLNSNPKVIGNKIELWNGQWLAHRYNGRTYDPSNPMASFNPFELKDNVIIVSTQLWTKILVGIAKTLSTRREIVYVYNLSKTNTTIGFIPIEIPQIRKPFELYEKYFGTADMEYVETIFGSSIGFEYACQMGCIGIFALRPKELTKYLTKETIPLYNNEKRINFNTYIIWLLAMLDNDTLWELSQKIAKHLQEFKLGEEKGSTKKKTLVEEILKSTKRELFLQGATAIIEKDSSSEVWEEIGKEIHKIPAENFTYFITLIRFQYAILIKK